MDSVRKMKKVSLYSILIGVHIILLIITLIGSLYVIAIGDSTWLIAILTIPLINILLLPITRKGERFDPTHPIFLILVSLMIGTVLRSFFIISPLQADTKFLMLLGEPPSILLKGIFAIYLGIIFFSLGYMFKVKPLPNWSGKKIFSADINLKKFVPIGILFTIISIGAAAIYFMKVGVNFSDLNAISQKRHYKMDEGGYASMGYYLLCMDLIQPIFYGLIMYIIVKKKPVLSFLGLFTLTLGLLNIIYPFIQSSRSNALYVLINSGLIFYYLKGGIKVRQLVIVVVAASMVLVVMTALRHSGNQFKSHLEVETNPLIIMVSSLNFLGVDKTSQIIDKVPEKMNYQFGTTLLLWIVAPVPRTLWHDKPETRIGLVIGEKIYEKRDENTAQGGVPPGFIGELYINFGYIGIVAGMFVFGVALRLVYNWLKTLRSKSILGMLIYIQAFIPLGLKLIGGDLTGITVNAFATTIPIVILMTITQKKDHSIFIN